MNVAKLEADCNMNCEFDYCIYNQNKTCILQNIQINDLGMCDQRIIVSINRNALETMKQKQLNEIELRWSAIPNDDPFSTTDMA